MGGTVADTAVWSLNLDENGDVLVALGADGGNSVIGLSPQGQLGKRFEGEITGGHLGIKLVHFWGMLHRFDAETRVGLGGTRYASRSPDGPAGPGWVIDVGSLPGNEVIALGRHNFKLAFTDDAWCENDPQ
jgi:hypothetical protein